jgi:hypothetical protein
MADFTYPKVIVREGYGDMAFTRANLCLLHEGKGVGGQCVGNMMPDAEIAHLFGCSSWEVSYARKHSAYWEQRPVESVAVEEEKQPVKGRKSKKD